MKYYVNVGNIGNIECKSKAQAQSVFRDYVRDSKLMYGRGSQEDVALFEDGEPIQEFNWYGWRIAVQEKAVKHCQEELDRAILIRDRLVRESEAA